MNRRVAAATALIFLFSPFYGLPAYADSDQRDQDVAWRAVERGDIKTLSEILVAIRSQLPGNVVGVKIEQKKGRWLYELRLADRHGHLFEVYVDAKGGTIDRIKEK